MVGDLDFNNDTFEIYYNQDGATSTSAVIGDAVAGAVTSVAQLGGALAQNRATKQASKSELTQAIESQCGKRTRFLSKKKRKNYQSCAEKVTDKYSAQTTPSAPRPTYQAPVIKDSSNKNLQTGLIVGGILLGLGILVYLRLRTKATPIVTQ